MDTNQEDEDHNPFDLLIFNGYKNYNNLIIIYLIPLWSST